MKFRPIGIPDPNNIRGNLQDLVTSLNAYAALDRAGNAEPILISALRNQVLLISSARAALVYSIQTSGIQSAHSIKYWDGDRPNPRRVS